MVLLTAFGVGFYVMQRRGLFGRLSRLGSRAFARRDWSSLTVRADAIDVAIRAMYRARRLVAATFVASFAGWVVGTGEVWIALDVLGHPVAWHDALLLESVGQAIRGAAFAIPGLARRAGRRLRAARAAGRMPLDAALALSLASASASSRSGCPASCYLHLAERHWRRHTATDRRRRLGPSTRCARSSSPPAAARGSTGRRDAAEVPAALRRAARCSSVISRSSPTSASTTSCWSSASSGSGRRRARAPRPHRRRGRDQRALHARQRADRPCRPRTR